MPATFERQCTHSRRTLSPPRSATRGRSTIPTQSDGQLEPLSGRVGHSLSSCRLLRLARLDVGASCGTTLVEFAESPLRIRVHNVVRLPRVLLRPRPAMGSYVENDA